MFGLNVWDTLQNIASLMLYSHSSINICYVGSHSQGRTRTINLSLSDAHLPTSLFYYYSYPCIQLWLTSSSFFSILF